MHIMGIYFLMVMELYTQYLASKTPSGKIETIRDIGLPRRVFQKCQVATCINYIHLVYNSDHRYVSSVSKEVFNTSLDARNRPQ